MTLFLDTNVVIALLKDQPPGVRRRFRRAAAQGTPIALSSVVVFELWYGVARSARPRENSQRLRAFLAGAIDVVSLDDDDAQQAGALRATLHERGTPIGPYDVLIAAQALRRSATLVTANRAEFGRVPGLRLQDWTSPRAS